MATHSSILAWRIPWIPEKPSREAWGATVHAAARVQHNLGSKQEKGGLDKVAEEDFEPRVVMQ